MPTTPDEIIDSAPWPVPEGTRLDPEAEKTLVLLHQAALSVQADVAALVGEAPVRRDPNFQVYLHDLAKIIDVLEAIVDVFRETQDHAAEAFCKALPWGTSSVTFADTRPLVPRFGGQRVKWENELLKEDVYPLVVMDPEDEGVFRHPEAVRDACFSVVSLNGSNVKVTGLRALGLDPDDYCHKVPKAAEVQVVK